MTTPTQPAHTPNLKLQRAIIELLQERFIEADGRYYEGWNDERVAKETGAALPVVKLVRREAFGALQEEDPEIALIKAEMKDIRKLADEYKTLVDLAIEQLNHRINTFVQARRKLPRGGG